MGKCSFQIAHRSMLKANIPIRFANTCIYSTSAMDVTVKTHNPGRMRLPMSSINHMTQAGGATLVRKAERIA